MAKKAVAKDLLKPVEAAAAANQDTVEAVIKAGEDAAKGYEMAVAATKVQAEKAVAATKVQAEKVVAATKAQAENAVAVTTAQAEKASAAAFKGYDDAAAIGQQTLDAYVQSTTLFAKGFELFSREVLAFTQSSIENNAAVAQALFNAKSVQEVVDLQTEYSRKSFDSVVEESGKLTEMSMDVASKAMEPIKAQVDQNVEKLFKPLAA